VDHPRFSLAFPYQPPVGQPRGRLRPLLPVRLHFRQASTPFLLALVDSGADASAFNIGVARRLGIDLAACRRLTIRGVGRAVEAYGCLVDVEIEGRRFPAEVRFVPTATALLGREDVFMQLKFAFDQRAHTLLVEPY